MKHPRNRIVAAAAAAIAVGALAACDPANGNSSTDSSSPEPSQTTSQPTEPATPRAEAIAQAKQLTRDYYKFREDAMQAPDGVAPNSWDPYLTDPELSEQRDYFRDWAAQGFSSDGGSASFKWMRVAQANVDTATGEANVTLKVCYDHSNIIYYDAQNRPVDKISPIPATVKIRSRDMTTEDGWRISFEDAQLKRCS